MNVLRSGQVHRFGDHVAAYVRGDDFKPGKYPATVYMAPADARAYAAALIACADSCEGEKASASTFRTVAITPQAEGL